MNIRLLDTNYYLTSDARQFILEKESIVTEPTSKNYGKPYRDQVGYFGKLDQAINAFIRHQILDSSATSLHALIDEMRKLEKLVSEQFHEKDFRGIGNL